jgi:hypothetical protein
MTSLDEPLSGAHLSEFVSVLPNTRWDRFEALLARASELLNPILVKEARQALRSKQFIVTFFLMLAAGWVWSILGLASIGPDVYYSAEGPQMFYVYHLILAFPLLVVAPYSAFHSLSSERQDRTYELVSITSLGARQILSGKLGSIVLQMLVYLSAIFPCLAFTYLLRGLDIFTIILAVVYTSCVSLGLSVTGLLLAALSPPRQRQLASAVFFAMALLGAFMLDAMWTGSLVTFGGAMVDSAEFWQVQVALLTFFLNYFAIVFLAARSQLMTVCQNRSSHLRIALVVAELSFLAWMAWLQLMVGGNVVFGLLGLTALFWYVAGVFLTGESGLLSPRVKRGLPQSVLGRVFLTWFAPGPGTGYMFVIANMLALSIVASLPYKEIAELFRGVPTGTAAAGSTAGFAGTAVALRLTRADVFETALVATSYLVIYLGIGKLLLSAIAKVSEVRLPTRVLVHLLLLMLGGGVPLIIQLSTPSLRNQGYTLLQITNPVWTVNEACGKGLPFDMPILQWVLPLAAALIWLANLPGLAAELRQVRIPKPERVVEEDAALAAQAAGDSLRKSPWD